MAFYKNSGQTPTQEKTVTSSRSSQTVTPDAGYALSKVTVNALVPSGTYKPTERKTNNDMETTGNYRYVDTTSIPNSNSGTYTYASGSTGGTVDMGTTNTYRYVNAANVYSKGKSDGLATYVHRDFTVINNSGTGVYYVNLTLPDTLKHIVYVYCGGTSVASSPNNQSDLASWTLIHNVQGQNNGSGLTIGVVQAKTANQNCQWRCYSSGNTTTYVGIIK